MATNPQIIFGTPEFAREVQAEFSRLFEVLPRLSAALNDLTGRASENPQPHQRVILNLGLLAGISMDGRLSFADREWTTGYNDTGGALFGAVNSLNGEGFRTCTVSADTHSSPDIIAQRVWINCGEKTIVLIRRSVAEKTYTSVMEQLGSMRDMTN